MSQDIKLICKNRQARRDFEIIETVEAGLALTGTEVKSLRAGNANLKDAWVKMKDDKASLEGAYIGLYSQGNRENHETGRSRPLLLKKRQIRSWQSQLDRKGLSCIPLSLYFKGSWCKVEIALARGRKRHDKRQALKSREASRDVEAALRRRR